MEMDNVVEIPVDCVSSLGHCRTIVHIDADCFYAQVEMLRNPLLRDKPLGIQQKNIVVTCNYKAREFGVNKLMFITGKIFGSPLKLELFTSIFKIKIMNIMH